MGQTQPFCVSQLSAAVTIHQGKQLKMGRIIGWMISQGSQLCYYQPEMRQIMEAGDCSPHGCQEAQTNRKIWGMRYTLQQHTPSHSLSRSATSFLSIHESMRWFTHWLSSWFNQLLKAPVMKIALRTKLSTHTYCGATSKTPKAAYDWLKAQTNSQNYSAENIAGWKHLLNTAF